jgi:hypothetical protein
MGKMQRTKGAAFEREVVKDLISRGFDGAKRNLEQTRSGGGDIDLPAYMIECKRYANIAVYQWLEQCVAAAREEQTPVVVARADNKKAIAILYWEDFMGMIDNAETLTKPYNPMVAANSSESSI